MRRTLASIVCDVRRPGLQRLGQVGVRGVGDRHLHVHPGVDGAGTRVGQVGGEAVGEQVAHGVGVADHETVEPPGLAQHLGEQPPVAGGRDAVEVHVAGHHVARAGLDRGHERREVDVPQLGVGQVDLVVVAAAEGVAVAGEVLGPGDDPLGCAELGPWKPRTWAAATAAPRYGSSPGTLDDPAPPRVAGDVDHRREGPVDADRPGLAGRRRPDPRSIVSGSQEAAIAIGTGKMVRSPWMTSKPNSTRDAEAVALDREPLQAVDLGRIGDEQQRTGDALPQLRLHHRGLLVGVEVQHRLRALGQAEVEVLRQLTRLLGRRHLLQQLVDLCLDVIVVSMAVSAAVKPLAQRAAVDEGRRVAVGHEVVAAGRPGAVIDP